MQTFALAHNTIELDSVRRYSIYIRNISQIKPVAQVAHFLVQTNMLKDDIIGHCNEWRDNFSDLLLKMTVDLIEGFYQYAHINSLRYIKMK